MRRSKDNLKKISELCDYLSDRDTRLKEEHLLLRKIVEDLPLKVFAIKVNRDMNIVSQLGTNVPSLSGKNLLEIFEKDSDYIMSCLQSMDGEDTKTVMKLGSNTFECTNKPIKNDEGRVSSVISVAWSRE
jgi:hypothetical protein